MHMSQERGQRWLLVPTVSVDGQDDQAWRLACVALPLLSAVDVLSRANLLTAVGWSWRSPDAGGLQGHRPALGERETGAARVSGSGANPPLGCRVPQVGVRDQAEVGRSRCGLLVPREHHLYHTTDGASGEKCWQRHHPHAADPVINYERIITNVGSVLSVFLPKKERKNSVVFPPLRGVIF
jgi:hypothetical protein